MKSCDFNVCFFRLENPYFRLLEGDSLTARLYDRLFVTVLFARQPPINLQQAEIRLQNSVTSSSPSVEPTINTLNNFKATIVYNQAVLSLTGSYNVQIVMGGGVVAQTPLSIRVNSEWSTIHASHFSLTNIQSSWLYVQ